MLSKKVEQKEKIEKKESREEVKNTNQERQTSSTSSQGHTELNNGSFSKTEIKKGVLEVMQEGYGFLRADGLNQSPDDIYISQSQIRRFDIRPGDEVEGLVRPPKETERYYGMLKVEKVNDQIAEKMARRTRFEKLTPV